MNSRQHILLATAYKLTQGTCAVQPWIDVLRPVLAITESSVSDCRPYDPTDSNSLLVNANKSLNSLGPAVQRALRFTDESPAAGLPADNLIHYETSKYADFNPDVRLGLAIPELPDVLIIQPRVFKATEYGLELATRGKYLKLIGTIQGNNTRQWAHIVKADDTAEAAINSQTQFLIFKQEGPNGCAVQPWFEVLSHLNKSAPVIKPDESNDCHKNVGVWYTLKTFEMKNPALLSEEDIKYSYSTPAETVLRMLARIGQTHGNTKSELVISPVTVQSANPQDSFPLEFDAFKKCFRLSATMQKNQQTLSPRLIDGDTAGAMSWTTPSSRAQVHREYPVDAETAFVVYKHSIACDKGEHGEAAQLRKAQEEAEKNRRNKREGAEDRPAPEPEPDTDAPPEEVEQAPELQQDDGALTADEVEALLARLARKEAEKRQLRRDQRAARTPSTERYW